MVCHETYKDENNNWLSPDEIFTNNGREFFSKKNPSSKIIVGPSESMSKSKKNTIDPQNIIEEYGADAVRFFIIADSPPEKDVQWSEEGMISSYKFLQKFWLLNEQILELNKMETKENHEEIDFFTNNSMDKINNALENFRYNIIVATMHEIYSFYKKISEKKINYSNLIDNYKQLLIVMMPVIPHFVNECLEKLNFTNNLSWPVVNNKFLKKENSNIVNQINGKKRSILKIRKDSKEEEIKEMINEKQLISKYLEDKKVHKIIFVPNKIINFIVK